MRNAADAIKRFLPNAIVHQLVIQLNITPIMKENSMFRVNPQGIFVQIVSKGIIPLDAGLSEVSEITISSLSRCDQRKTIMKYYCPLFIGLCAKNVFH